VQQALVDAVEDEVHGRNSAMTYARLLEPQGHGARRSA
jgi:hypothetical protein